ncbi:MAG: PAS domain S-box protein [Cyanobacteriota bacterium]
MPKHSENLNDSSLTLGLKRFSKKVSLVVPLVGFIVILAWVFDIPLLKGILPNLPTMKVNTALCFLLGGTSLWLWHWQGKKEKEKGKRKIQILSLSLAFLIALIALLTLIQYGFNLNLGIDEFLIQQPEPLGSTAAPGRMAPNTALAFLFEGSALLLLNVNRPNYLAIQGMAIGGWLIGFVGLLGYVYGSVYFYTAGSYTGMAVHTAIAFLLLASGILCARPDRGLMLLLCSDGAGSLMMRRLLPFAIFVPVLVEGLSAIGYHWSFYNEQMEATLSSALDIILFSGLVGWNAYKLNRFDSHRRRTELARQQANEQLQQELRSRRQAEDALQVSQARLAGILEVANDAIVSIDEHQRITLFNHGAEQIFGYSASEILGQPLSLLIPTRFAAAHHQHVSNFGNSAGIAQRMGERSEIFARRKDGTEFPAEASISKLEMGGKKLFTAFMRDISDRFQAQEALVKLAAIVESSDDAIISKSLDGIILSWNAGAQRIFGYSANDAIGQPMSILIPPDRTDEEPQILQKIKQGERIEHYETVRRHKNGQLIDVSVTVSPIKDTAGKIIAASAIKRDITKRKRMELELRSVSDRLQYLLTASPAVIFTCSPDGDYGTTFVSENVSALLGYQARDLLEDSSFWVTHVHPDDIDRILAGVSRLLEQECYSHEYRFLHTDGTYRWIYAHMRCVKDETGKPQEFVGYLVDITERKRAEEKLRESEAALAQAQRVAHVGNWELDVATKKITWSDELFHLFGFDPAQPEPAYAEHFQYIYPDDRVLLEHHLNQAMTDGTPYKIDLRIWRTDGSMGCIEARGEAERDDQGRVIRLFGTALDISDRFQAQEKLRHREAQLNTIISTTSDGIIILDRVGRICFANPAAARLFEKSLEELIGYHWGMPEGETTELELVRCGEEIQTVEMRATPIEWLSKPAYIVALRDITERKQFELELQRAKEAAEVANQAKSIFLANMSHELRTPLNVILGFTQVMNRDSSLSPEQFQHLQIISNSGNHLLNLINDVLDLSKIEAGRLTLDESSFDLIALMRSLHEMLRQKALAKGLQFNLEIAPDIPQYVSADSNKLRQVLINLLGNAIKFTQKGSVTLQASVVSSNKQRTTDNGQLTIHFEISDTGVGIAPTELETIFDAFVQTQAGRVSNEGTGLGLTITRKFVQLMGSNLTIKSTLGQGSTFSFEIQVCLANAWDVQPTQTYQQAIGLASGQPPYRILVADDQPENRLLLVKLLTQLGLEVREAKNGQEAVNLWQQWQPHLIWMDIRMPLMDGYAATQQIRSSVEGQSTIIIALTAQASNSDRTLALKAGCNDYITKPFQEETLFAKMAEHLGLRYLYANSERLDAVSRYNDDKAQAASLTPESLCVMPKEWMNQLHEAAELCDEEEILYLLEQIPSEHTSLIAGLNHFARNYQFDAIAQLIQAISPPQSCGVRCNLS